jgi:hypothetical protein
MLKDLYKPVKLNDFEIIQNKMMQVVSKYSRLDQPMFKYVDVLEFKDIPELKPQLQHLGLYDYIKYSVINLSMKGTSPIHRDTGDFTYSLNIPLFGYQNTYLHYFSNENQPRIQGTGQGGVTYLLYNHSESTFIGKVETNEPAIVNTQQPHCFQNLNVLPRVVILLRISNQWNSK